MQSQREFDLEQAAYQTLALAELEDRLNNDIADDIEDAVFQLVDEGLMTEAEAPSFKRLLEMKRGKT
jgi:hypothetical protein